jgi:pimeloyl-ACP methyl ester carboxylesterase
MDATFRLSDGRQLGYALWGDPDGFPVVYISGIPATRYEARIFAHDGAVRAGVKLIAVERPGYGLSDFQPGRAIPDFARDVAQLATALGHERFAVVGLSGGGPYAAACAAKLPERVAAAGIVSGLGPLDIPELEDGRIPLSRVFKLFRLLGRFPWIARLSFGVMAFLGKVAPELALKILTEQVPPLDKVVLSRDGIWRLMREHMLTKPFERGLDGVVLDASLYARPWGFRLEDIRTRVFVWHGEADVQCPVAMGRYVAEHIPGCEATWVPEAGHLLICDHAETIFRKLAESAKAVGKSSAA